MGVAGLLSHLSPLGCRLVLPRKQTPHTEFKLIRSGGGHWKFPNLAEGGVLYISCCRYYKTDLKSIPIPLRCSPKVYYLSKSVPAYPSQVFALLLLDSFLGVGHIVLRRCLHWSQVWRDRETEFHSERPRLVAGTLSSETAYGPSEERIMAWRACCPPFTTGLVPMSHIPVPH